MKISKQRLTELIQEELAVGFQHFEEPEVDGEHPVDPYGYEGRMFKQNLWKIAEYAKEMYELVEDNEDLEPWVEEKIAVAAFMMDSAGHYLKYEKHRSHEDSEGEKDHIDNFEDEQEESEDDEEYEFEPDEEEIEYVDGEEEV